MVGSIALNKQLMTTPYQYAKTCLRIKNKHDRIVPLVYNQAQRHYMANRTQYDIIVKARQLGFSTAIQGEFNRKLNTSPARCITLSDTDANTKKLRRIARRFVDEWQYPETAPIIGEDNAGMMTFTNTGAESTIVTAGAKTGGRGGTYRYMHGSEVAFWNNADETLTAVLEAVPLHGRVVLESTTNGAQGKFYELVQEGLAGGNKWTVHFYEWWWDDNYRIPLLAPDEITPTEDETLLMQLHGLDLEQIKFRREKQSDLKEMFFQEYPESIHTCFLTSGNGYFGDITSAFNAPMNEAYNPDHTYVAGLDFGQTNDYTVLSIGCINTGNQVDMIRLNRQSWESMYQQIAIKCKQWHVTNVLADATSMQTAIIAQLNNVVRAHDLSTRVVPFTFTARNKPDLVIHLRNALHGDALSLLNLPVQRNEFTIFIAKQSASGNWQYTHPSGGHDDTVIAIALMFRAMRVSNMDFSGGIL